MCIRDSTERETERDRDTERGRERDRDRETKRDTQRQRHTETETEKKTDRQKPLCYYIIANKLAREQINQEYFLTSRLQRSLKNVALSNTIVM